MENANTTYNKGLLYEYMRVRKGNIKNGKPETFSNTYFGPAREKSERMAIELFRMVVEIFLHWSPIDCKERMSWKIIEIMKLTDIYKYLPFPPYLDREKDYWYIAHILYPAEIPFSSRQLTIEVYKRILDGELYKFPKKFFDSADGRERACICLNYYLEHYESITSIEELYKYFASNEGKAAIESHGFRVVWNQLFGSPVAFLHEALSESDKDELLFHYYEFEYQYSVQLKSEKRAKNIEKKIKRNAEKKD